MFEIVRSAGFAADTAQFETAERLAANTGPRDGPIEIQVPDGKILTDSFEIRRTPTVNSTGQGIIRIVGDGNCFGEITRFKSDQDPAVPLVQCT